MPTMMVENITINKNIESKNDEKRNKTVHPVSIVAIRCKPSQFCLQLHAILKCSYFTGTQLNRKYIFLLTNAEVEAPSDFDTQKLLSHSRSRRGKADSVDLV